MSGEYPKLVQQVDFLKLRVAQQDELIKALRARVRELETGGVITRDSGAVETIEKHTKIYESEIVDD